MNDTPTTCCAKLVWDIYSHSVIFNSTVCVSAAVNGAGDFESIADSVYFFGAFGAIDWDHEERRIWPLMTRCFTVIIGGDCDWNRRTVFDNNKKKMKCTQLRSIWDDAIERHWNLVALLSTKHNREHSCSGWAYSHSPLLNFDTCPNTQTLTIQWCCWLCNFFFEKTLLVVSSSTWCWTYIVFSVQTSISQMLHETCTRYAEQNVRHSYTYIYIVSNIPNYTIYFLLLTRWSIVNTVFSPIFFSRFTYFSIALARAFGPIA